MFQENILVEIYESVSDESRLIIQITFEVFKNVYSS